MTGKSLLIGVAFFGVIAAGLVNVNRQGWERDERRQARQEDEAKRRAEYEARGELWR